MAVLLGLIAPLSLMVLWWRWRMARGNTDTERLWRGMPGEHAYSTQARADYTALGRFSTRAIFTAAILLWFPGMLIVLVIVALLLDGQDLALMAIIPSLVVITMLVPFELALGMQRGALRARLTVQGCGRCGYSLESLPVRDGLKTCPECGLVRCAEGT